MAVVSRGAVAVPVGLVTWAVALVACRPMVGCIGLVAPPVACCPVARGRGLRAVPVAGIGGMRRSVRARRPGRQDGVVAGL